jgi:hypothetical protein
MSTTKIYTIRASNLWYPDIPAIADFKFGYWKSPAQYPEIEILKKFCPQLKFKMAWKKSFSLVSLVNEKMFCKCGILDFVGGYQILWVDIKFEALYYYTTICYIC